MVVDYYQLLLHSASAEAPPFHLRGHVKFVDMVCRESNGVERNRARSREGNRNRNSMDDVEL